MHQRGWLHETVLTSCLHTNQRWCLLSALILVNTDVYVRKQSDRCMIEVLKSRDSQQLSSALSSSPTVAVILFRFSLLLLCASALLYLLPCCLFYLILLNWCNTSHTLVINGRRCHPTSSSHGWLSFLFFSELQTFHRWKVDLLDFCHAGTGFEWTLPPLSKTLRCEQVPLKRDL